MLHKAILIFFLGIVFTASFNIGRDVYFYNIEQKDWKPSSKEQVTSEISQIHVVGNQIIQTKSNTPIILKGVVSDYFRSDYNNGLGFRPVETEFEKIDKLRSFGINLVGLYLSNSSKIKSNLETLDSYINYARNNNFYVYLMPVARSFYNDPKRDYNIPPETYDDLKQLIELLTLRYLEYPNVIYGFGAEPGDNIENFDSWNKKQIELAGIVRGVNSNAVLLITAADNYSQLSKYSSEPFPFNNVIYQGGGYLASDDKGAKRDLLNEESINANINNIVNSLDNKRFPLLIGEFGGNVTGDFSSETDLNLTKRILDEIYKNKLSFTAYRLGANFKDDPLALFDSQNNLTKKGKLFIEYFLKSD